jgi:L-alanine-DL-glutamate epimerase-like enolase superfamily enzyme
VITNVRLHRLRVPFRTPVRHGTTDIDALDLLVVQLVGDDGVVGWGEIPARAGSLPVPAEASDSAAIFAITALLGTRGSPPAAIAEAAADIVLGPRPGVEARVHPSGPLGPAFAAGIATAVLDLVGRQRGRPLVGLLGKDPTARIAVNGLVRADRSDPDRVVEEAAAQLRTGIRTLKLKAGDPADLEAALRALREAFGSEIRLRVDWNGRFDPAEAATQLRRLEWADLEYVEDPIPAEHGPEAFARLRRASAVPIAVDEAISDPGAATAVLDAEAADVLVVKPARVGGPLAAFRIVEAATARGVPVTISSLYETGIGLAAALHVAAIVPGDRAHGLATADLLVDDLVVEPLSVEDGRIALPTEAGLGITVDEAALARYAVGGGGRRPTGRTRRR